MTLAKCDCDPGNTANGWHETRGPRCAALDRQGWRDFFDTVPDRVQFIINTMNDPRIEYAIPQIHMLGGKSE